MSMLSIAIARLEGGRSIRRAAPKARSYYLIPRYRTGAKERTSFELASGPLNIPQWKTAQRPIVNG